MAAWQPHFSAAASGLLLAVSDYPVHLWPLSLIAFVPLFYALIRFEPSVRCALGMGLAFGIAYTGPSLAALEFPVMFAIPLGAVTTLFWGLTILIVRRFTILPGIRASIAVGLAGAFMDWAYTALVPVFGTAQSFTRTLSATPWAMQLASVVGMTGLAFVLLGTQMLLARVLARREHRAAHVAVLAAIAALYAMGGILRARLEPPRTVRMAAFGWADGGPDPLAWMRVSPQTRVEGVYASAIAEASRAQSALIVFPEVGIMVDSASRTPVLRRLSELAQVHGITVAVGYFDLTEARNKSVFLAPDGGASATYVKTHLIPFLESYQKGDGTLVEMRVQGIRVGTMICQDDNFTDLARRYGALGTSVVAVPTNDWKAVSRVHFENSLFRPVESGYGMVRAAHDGVSAIVSPRGHILAKRDHFRDGPGLVVADVPLGDGPTIYARWGHFIPALGLVLLALALGRSGLRSLQQTRLPSSRASHRR